MSRSSNSDPDLDAGAEPSADTPAGDVDTEAFGLGDVTWADDVQDAGVFGHTAQTPAQGVAGPDEAPESAPDADPDGAVAHSADPDAEAGSGPADGGPIAVEDLVQDLERVAAERDQYLDASRRVQAEFENYRKVVSKREIEAQQRANESLVTELLPVLDACDAAVANGADDVVPVHSTLMEALLKNGLERIDDADGSFDPERHDAVMHEPADDEAAAGPVVAEVMRAGYLWKGRVLRPAMVRVKG